MKGAITVANIAAPDIDVNNTNKQVIFKNSAPFTDSISETKNMQVNNAKDHAVIIPMYNLLESSNN